jgi:hypothetical protein
MVLALARFMGHPTIILLIFGVKVVALLGQSNYDQSSVKIYPKVLADAPANNPGISLSAVCGG